MKLLTTVAVLWSTSALAGNQGSFFLGNGAALSGGVVAVVGDDGASLWYNPAGLIVSKKDRVDLSGSAYTLRLRSYPGILRGDMPDRPDDEDPLMDLSSNDVLVVPSAVAYVRHVSEDLAVGIGVFVPLLDSFSATSELKVRDPSVGLDAAAEIGAETTVYSANIGLGWRALPRLRVGATLALYYQEVDIAQTLLWGYESTPTDDPTRGNGALVQEDAIERVGFNLFFGVQWQPSDKFGLGLVVRTPLIQFYESFKRRRFLVTADVAPDGTPATTTSFLPLRRQAFDAAVFLNFSATFAVAWIPEDGSYLGLELDVQPGSKDDGIVRDLVWNVRVGGTVALSDTMRFGAGVFTDQSWEPEPTTAWVDRVDYYGVATGIYFETPLRLAEADSDSLVFTSTFGLRYAIGFGDTLRAVADPSGFDTDPTLTKVDLVFHEIGLHIGSGLRF